MKIKSSIVSSIETFYIECGAGYLCSVSSDMSDPWQAHDPSDEMPSFDVATDAEIEAALGEIEA